MAESVRLLASPNAYNIVDATWRDAGARALRELWELSMRAMMGVLRSRFLLILHFGATAFVGGMVAIIFHDLPFVRSGMMRGAPRRRALTSCPALCRLGLGSRIGWGRSFSLSLTLCLSA